MIKINKYNILKYIIKNVHLIVTTIKKATHVNYSIELKRSFLKFKIVLKFLFDGGFLMLNNIKNVII